MRIATAAACLFVLVSCGRQDPEPKLPQAATRVERTPAPPDAQPVSLDPLPARFSGVLPCADCAGTRYEVDLRPNNIYFLRMTYLGATPERSYDDIGGWSLASDLRTLALKGARQSPLLFSIADASALRKLDAEGQDIESELNYRLERADSYEPLVPLVPLRGMYSSADSGAVLEECTTGLKMQIEGAGADRLAEEFERLRKHTSRPILLAGEGRIETRESHTSLVITSAAKFWPGESCGARGVTHALEGSRWVLVRLGEMPVVPDEGKPEPYIVLQPGSKQIVGHAGCNRLTGDYAIEGNRIHFPQLTTTRMACPEPEADTENAFLSALESVAQWRLADNQLVLLDQAGGSLVQLESRNL